MGRFGWQHTQNEQGESVNIRQVQTSFQQVILNYRESHDAENACTLIACAFLTISIP